MLLTARRVPDVMFFLSARCLPDKKLKISARSLALASAPIAPKICQASGKQCVQSTPNIIKIGSLPAEL